MVQVPEASEQWEAEVHGDLVIFAPSLGIVFQIRQEHTAERRELYLRTFLDTIDGWLRLDHQYSEIPRIIGALLAGFNRKRFFYGTNRLELHHHLSSL